MTVRVNRLVARASRGPTQPATATPNGHATIYCLAREGSLLHMQAGPYSGVEDLRHLAILFPHAVVIEAWKGPVCVARLQRDRDGRLVEGGLGRLG